MPFVRILLVDDDDIVREALKTRLAREDDMKIVGSVATGEEALLAAERLKPDLIILDLSLSGVLSGFDTMRSVIKALPHVRFVVLSAKQSPEHVQQAFALGAAAYVCKLSAGIDLLDAVHAVTTGHKFSSAAVRHMPAHHRDLVHHA